jgi:hypothetical protein
MRDLLIKSEQFQMASVRPHQDAQGAEIIQMGFRVGMLNVARWSLDRWIILPEWMYSVPSWQALTYFAKSEMAICKSQLQIVETRLAAVDAYDFVNLELQKPTDSKTAKAPAKAPDVLPNPCMAVPVFTAN